MRTLQAGTKKKKKPQGKPAAPKGDDVAKGAAAPQKKGKGGGGDKDDRFAKRFSDPRFGYGKQQKPGETEGKKKKKVLTEKDDRFALGKFKGTKVDSRGRPIVQKAPDSRDLTSKVAPKGVKAYYKQLRKDRGQDVSDDEDEDVEEASEALSDEDDVAMDSDSDMGEQSVGSDIYEGDEEEETEEATKRIALKNADWDHLDATHLFALMQSFVPRGGALLHLAIYKSGFGKEQLEHEAKHGPNIWLQKGEKDEVAEEGEDEGEEAMRFEEMEDEERAESSDVELSDEGDFQFEEDNPAIRTEVGDGGEKFSENKYRRYELQRLRYYYAIAEFDNADTARHVYRECHGTEIERSGTVFDLSFVPDEMDFEEDPTDECGHLPSSYKGAATFTTNALQNSRFAISWDQTDPKRKRAMTAAARAGHEDMDDIEAYLAPVESSDEESDKEAETRRIRAKYAALFDSIGGLSKEKPESEEDANDADDEEEEGEEDSDSAAGGLQAEWSDDDIAMNDDADSVDGEDAALVAQQLADLPSDENGDDEQGVMGNMESTMHLGAKEGAKNLKDVLRTKAAREGETVWEKRQRLKKEGRKQAKKEKMQSRKDADEKDKSSEDEETKAEQYAKLKGVLGDVQDPDEEPGARGKKARMSKKDKRKAHKAKKVQEAAAEREAKREKRVAAATEAVRPASAAKKAAVAEEAAPATKEAKLLDRFGKLSDPRFNLDPNHPKFRDSDGLKALGDQVRTKRKRKLSEVEAAPAPATDDVAKSVAFFQKKARKA